MGIFCLCNEMQNEDGVELTDPVVLSLFSRDEVFTLFVLQLFVPRLQELSFLSYSSLNGF